MTAVPAAARPADYRIAVPDGWFRIDLRPGVRKRAVQALLNRQFRGAGSASRLREQLRGRLMAMAQSAYASGGIEIYLCVQEILGVPMPASLVISLTPPAPDGRTVTPEQLAGTLTGDREVSLAGLPAGTAVRTRRRTAPPADDRTGNTLPVTNLDLYVPVPASGSYLVLAFSTNLDPLADSLVGLFDAIAGTLEWLP